ncbi:MAG: beta-propeller fold lactonase family protein [Rubrobacter sp.]|nr:beta-propeller fold lactonase family protein [Rubrobacter sp.]
MAALLVFAACGAEQNAGQEPAGQEPAGQEPAEQESTEQESTEQESTERTAPPEEPPRMPEDPPEAPEPAESPPLEEEPTGEVVDVGSPVEGVVADPETGLVAMGTREGGNLLLADGESGEVEERVDVGGRARHLDLAEPGGPVLVPVEREDAFFVVGLPDGEIVEEVPVGDFPHDAAAYEGRFFVLNEFESTASVIENGEITETFETPFQPGGVAITDDGVVGIVGVRGLAVEFYDAETLESLGRLEAGEGPTHIVAGSDGRFYATDTRGDALLVYDVSGSEPEMVESIPLEGGSPYGIAIDREREELWVTLAAENGVVRYDVGDGSPEEMERYPTVRQPNTVAVNSESGRVFVTGSEGGDLQIFDPG